MIAAEIRAERREEGMAGTSYVYAGAVKSAEGGKGGRSQKATLGCTGLRPPACGGGIIESAHSGGRGWQGLRGYMSSAQGETVGTGDDGVRVRRPAAAAVPFPYRSSPSPLRFGSTIATGEDL